MAHNLPSQVALKKLQLGNSNFVKSNLKRSHQNIERRNELISGQNPFAIILSCADSRVVPELVFDVGLGDLFTIRVAGNVANTSTVASIEYAVAHLGVNLVVVMGHENCGAVTAALGAQDNGYNLNHLLTHILPACRQVNSSEVNAVVKKNAELTVQEIIGRSAIIKNKVAEKLQILPAYYSLTNGVVTFLT